MRTSTTSKKIAKKVRLNPIEEALAASSRERTRNPRPSMALPGDFDDIPPVEQEIEPEAEVAPPVESREEITASVIAEKEKPPPATLYIEVLNSTQLARVKSYVLQNLAVGNQVSAKECMPNELWQELQTLFYRHESAIQQPIEELSMINPEAFFNIALRFFSADPASRGQTPKEFAASLRLSFVWDPQGLCLRQLDPLGTRLRELQNMTSTIKRGSPEMLDLIATALKALQVDAGTAQESLVTLLKSTPGQILDIADLIKFLNKFAGDLWRQGRDAVKTLGIHFSNPPSLPPAVTQIAARSPGTRTQATAPILDAPTPSTQVTSSTGDAKERLKAFCCGKYHTPYRADGSPACHARPVAQGGYGHPNYNPNPNIPWDLTPAGAGLLAHKITSLLDNYEYLVDSNSFKEFKALQKPTIYGGGRGTSSLFKSEYCNLLSLDQQSGRGSNGNNAGGRGRGKPSLPTPTSSTTNNSIAVGHNNGRGRYQNQRGDLINFSILNTNNEYSFKGTKMPSALLDTGALHGDYISPELASYLRINYDFKICSCNKRICSFNGNCVEATKFLNIKILITNAPSHPYPLELKTTILQSPYDLIIGRPSILKYNLLPLIQITDTVTTATRQLPSDIQTDLSQGRPKDVVATLIQVNPIRDDDLEGNTVSDSHVRCNGGTLVNSLFQHGRKINKNEIFTTISDDDYIDYSQSSDVHELINKPVEVNTSNSLYPQVHGTPEEKISLRALCDEYSDIFSETLSKNHALVEPLVLHVDETQWFTTKNQSPARFQTPTKDEEIKNQIESMLTAGVIRPSQAIAHSQVLLTPKPNGKWRFCIDFRSLNLATQSLGWPIPNITSMLRRLGQANSKTFGKMDLTSGYFQAPLSENSRRYTAFIAWCGLYEWTRVPMGLKGAPSYFQQMMATIVLVGHIHIICEVYLDDILIHAKTHTQFLKRLRLVFERFRKHK